MNDLTQIIIYNSRALKVGILLLYLAVASLIVLYNLLYLYYAPHVSRKHMGITPPTHIDRIIKSSSFIALATAGFIILLLLTGYY